ncbi:ribonuclease BN (tRNA processing enzyme) [Caldicellulosiruptor bescii]|uniref:Beta-lactamase domain protein n=2 Tax=Caldicellulosiruptor bescii TaxID=31899 RepID=B9MRC3_CALBD|nr:MBL fold metallo-hydrolase [Caldicellulosiruptor bescii]ACM60227.1 beta-lactamase domain protein [Caldicellulosiruptor bescii DSM 6725]PBC87642.1 ribonuclease BN (tRNA processing enzyme) [Caldicellulosiruptor bescii]PBC90575.1 ribonuclease BN (tRNA processing enzyme) [Caldicellulosiruptor bescii]PBD03993.1 ribonuclease BN (tRNA processing enzyme) [Caldicellulosiruptor bescii]PBD06372.1 ribonuclease BN (tRNA processing enzyme) [Caldicellulosiruptor bescii]
MILNILGARGPYPAKGEPTSGYLLRTKEANILLECGSGVLTRLLNFISFDEISFIICSHLHADHTSDLGVLRYYLASRGKEIDLYIPSEPKEEYDLIRKGVYRVKEIENNMEAKIGNLTIKFLEGQHPYKSFAVKIEVDDKVFGFSGDTGFKEELIEFFKDADILLLNAAYTDKEVEKIEPEKRFHLSPKQAAEIAKRANAKLLVLTHLKPECSEKEHLLSAKEVFENVVLATDNDTIEF